MKSSVGWRPRRAQGEAQGHGDLLGSSRLRAWCWTQGAGPGLPHWRTRGSKNVQHAGLEKHFVPHLVHTHTSHLVHTHASTALHTHIPTHPCAHTTPHPLHTQTSCRCTLLCHAQASLSDLSVSHLPSPLLLGPGSLAAAQEPLHILCWAMSPSTEGGATYPPLGEVLPLQAPSRPCPV